MFDTIIEFLASHKEVIGAFTGMIESIVIVINSWKKFKTNKGGVDTMSAPPSRLRTIVDVCNPVNVFRKS